MRVQQVETGAVLEQECHFTVVRTARLAHGLKFD